MGRQLQEQQGQEGQVVLTTPLLEGLDGVQKMSKSLGNYIGIAEAPPEQFGKLMSLPDELMPRYFLLTTGWHPDRVDEVVGELGSGALRPVEAKRLLARTVVDLYHGPTPDGRSAGEAAEAEFDKVFLAHEAPSEMPEHVLDDSEAPDDGRLRLSTVLRQAGLVPSNREGARKIAEGSVRLNGDVVRDPDASYTLDELDGVTLQMGKRNWARIRRA
jgi:tyrosyl-tRNA synthetase